MQPAKLDSSIKIATNGRMADSGDFMATASARDVGTAAANKEGRRGIVSGQPAYVGRHDVMLGPGAVGLEFGAPQ